MEEDNVRIRIKRAIKGAKGLVFYDIETLFKVVETQVKKKRFLIEFKAKSWFIDFKDAEVI